MVKASDKYKKAPDPGESVHRICYMSHCLEPLFVAAVLFSVEPVDFASPRSLSPSPKGLIDLVWTSTYMVTCLCVN